MVQLESIKPNFGSGTVLPLSYGYRAAFAAVALVLCSESVYAGNIAASPDSTGFYKVQKGDTLTRIATAFYNDPAMAKTIAAENGLSNPNSIKPNQRLKLPSKPRPQIAGGAAKVRPAWDLSETLLHGMSPEKYAGIDPRLAHSQIFTESTWKKTARGKAGEIGLMQLKLSTAKEVARLHGLPEPTEKSLEDPYINVQLGCLHMADLLEHYNGDKYAAYAAYKAGRPRIDEFYFSFGLRGPKLIDSVKLETRKYVLGIINRAGIGHKHT